MLTIPLTELQEDRQQAERRAHNLAEFLEANHPTLIADPAWQTYRTLAEQAVTDLWDLLCAEEETDSDPGTPYPPTTNPNP